MPGPDVEIIVCHTMDSLQVLEELLKILGSRFKTLFINSSSIPSLDGMFQYLIKWIMKNSSCY